MVQQMECDGDPLTPRHLLAQAMEMRRRIEAEQSQYT